MVLACRFHAARLLGRALTAAAARRGGPPLVLEWGSGLSTLIFPPCASLWVSVEHDVGWCQTPTCALAARAAAARAASCGGHHGPEVCSRGGTHGRAAPVHVVCIPPEGGEGEGKGGPSDG